MGPAHKTFLLAGGIAIIMMFLFAMPALARINGGTDTSRGEQRPQPQKAVTTPAPNQPQACATLGKPSELPSPALINFDDLADATVIGDRYLATFGVSFENSPTNRAIIYGNEPAKAASPPNVASNNAVFPNTSNNVPLVIQFSHPKSHVGFYIGNSENTPIVALLTAYNVDGKVICQARFQNVPEPATLFVGFSDSTASISKVTLDYGDSSLSEVIDDLYFSPREDLPPTRTPVPTWTAVPSATPTQGPTPTSTPAVPMFSYRAVVPVTFPAFPVLPDLSVQGIEVTQGIQCFDTSKGLSTCPDNSLPLVNKKDTTARIYLKLSGPYSSLSSVPVRLFLTANGVTYQADAMGKATPTINQGVHDAGEIYFNVNFNSTVAVNFYAVVDPDNTIFESNETNNRFPASGTITLNFQNRTTMKVVGQRADYHPSGYSGTRYAGGWAVNGGAADWWEQVLPIRNNGIDYSVASGYLDWTNTFSPCSTTGNAQHSMISTLNTLWTIENAFSIWFSGAFTGATHVYGWLPNAGYPCGHADMPVYPHAGGLGVVGIGGDAPGTNTDNPGSGALIFGHELTHDYDLKHTNTADSCGSNDSTSSFPYSSSSIQEFGFNPITGKIYDPANTHDLMSYCPSGGSKQGWISPYTWQTMFTDLSSPIALSSVPVKAAPNGVLAPSAASESLEVYATIYNPAMKPPTGGKLGDLYKVSAGATLTLPAGPYAVELRDAQNNILASQTFAVNFDSEYDAHEAPGSPNTTPPFSPDPNSSLDVHFIMPWVSGTSSVVLTYQGAIYDQRFVSANAPQVLITSPTAQENWLPGSTHTLSWQGLDLDGDPLSYSVFYSHDGGANWEAIQTGLTTTSLDISTDAMAGGSDVRFRVAATDGVLTGLAETDQAISIPNHSPEALIMYPVQDQIFLPGDLVVLQGMAVDMEDGTLPDEALSWSSDKQGGLGTGPSLALNSLKDGVHTIILTATDSYGISSTAKVQITIGYPSFLPKVSK